MDNWILKIILISFIFISNAVFAEEEFCTPIALKAHDKNIVLPGAASPNTTQIYFLLNIAKQSLWLDHPTERTKSANAGWSSYFQPGKWSAILVNHKDFIISCAVIHPGKVEYKPCVKTIAACVPHKLFLDSKRKDSYWLAEDKTWLELIDALEKRGIQFPRQPEKKH